MLCSPVLATSGLSTSPEEVHDSLGGSTAALVTTVVVAVVGICKLLVALVKCT
jgi:hypothetical protein